MALRSDTSIQNVGGSNGGSPQRMVPEEDLRKERERWMQTSMRQFWDLENMAAERIDSKLEEALGRLQKDVAGLLAPRVEAERSERAAAVAELREQLRAQRAAVDAELAALHTNLAAALHEARRRQAPPPESAASDWPRAEAVDAAVRKLRQEFEAHGAEQLAELAALRAQAEQGRLQALAAESTISDLRSDISLRADQQEAAHGQLRQDLRRELERVRGELEADRRQAEDQAMQHSRMEASVSDLRGRVEESSRRLGELRQDQLSQTTVLQSRVEAAVGDREEHQSHIDSMRLLMKEEQGRRNAEGAALRQVEAAVGEMRGRIDELSALPTRIESLEVAFKDTIAAVSRQLDGPQTDTAALSGRVAALEQGLARQPSRGEPQGHAEELFASSLADLRRRLESVEGARGDPVLASGAAATAEEVAALRGDVQQLAQDLAVERRERCRAVTDNKRLTEDVAKAAAATIERAERKLLDEWSGAGSEGHSPAVRTPIDLKSPLAVDVDQEWSPGVGQAAGVRSSALSSGFARLVGEMDAELRVELNSRIKLLATELRSEILSETSAKVAGLESKTSAAEANLQARLQRLAEDVALCLSKEDGIQLVQKVSSLEGNVKTNSGILSAFLEEQKKKATVTAVDEIEAAVQRGMSAEHPRTLNQSRSPGEAPAPGGTMHTGPSSISGSSAKQHGHDTEVRGAEPARPGFADYPAKDRLQGLISAIDRERSIDNSLDKLRKSIAAGSHARREDDTPASADPASAAQYHTGQHVEDSLNASRGAVSTVSTESTRRGSTPASRSGFQQIGRGPTPPLGRSGQTHSAADAAAPSSALPARRDHHDQWRAALADGVDMATQSWPGAEARYAQSPGVGLPPSAAAQAGLPSRQGGAPWQMRGATLAAAPGQPMPGQPGAQAAPQQRLSVQQPGGCPAQAGVQPWMSGAVPMRPGAYPSSSSYTVYR